MAITVSSIDELKKVMMEQVYEAMEKSSDDLIDYIKGGIIEKVYSYEPIRYDRTYSLLDTLRLNNSKKNSNFNSKRAFITIDHNKSEAEWESVKSGNRYFNVPERVTYGGYGTFKGIGADGEWHDINPKDRKNREWSKKRDYMEYTKKQMGVDGYLNRCLKPHLPSYITVK